MLSGKPIKKIVCILSYLILLYYLLPFRPIYLYYIAHHKSASIVHDNKNESEQLLAGNKSLLKSADSFPQKDRSRFDLDHPLLIHPVLEKFVFSYKQISFSYPRICYADPLLFYNSNRGPPCA